MFPAPPTLSIISADVPPLGHIGRPEFWRSVPAVALAEAETGAAPEQGTALRAAWAGGWLHLQFHAIDSEPWATLRERDAALYTEEVVEVFLDPVGDLAAYFEIEVNPLNTVLDLMIRRTRAGLTKDFRWQCEGLQTEVTRTADGWTADLTLPLGSLAGEMPVAGTRWRGNFCRIDRPPGRSRELTAWSPTGRPSFHVPPRFGHLLFE